MVLSGNASPFSVYSVVVAFLTISFLAIVLRLGARLAIVNQLSWSDLLIVGAWVFGVAMGAAVWKQVEYGKGVHSSTIGNRQLEAALSWFWASLWLYYVSLCLTKLSVLAQYLRIFPSRLCVRICYALLATVVIWGSWAILSGIFTCWPISKYWTDSGWASEKCLSRIGLWYTNATFNIATDIATSLLPLPVISVLDISKGQKKVLRVIFAAGLLTCAFSIIRLVYVYPLAVSSDFTWQSPMLVILSCIEANTAITCTCVPALRVLAQRLLPERWTSATSTHFPTDQPDILPIPELGVYPERQSAQRNSSPSELGLEKPVGSEVQSDDEHASIYYSRASQIDAFFESRVLEYFSASVQASSSSPAQNHDIIAPVLIKPLKAATRSND